MIPNINTKRIQTKINQKVHLALLKAEYADSHGWYLDFGASSHTTPNGKIMVNKKKADVNEIVVANDERM